jgi:hypothetical protein
MIVMMMMTMRMTTMTMGMMMQVPGAMMTREREFVHLCCPVEFWASQDVVCLLVMHVDHTSPSLHSRRV